MSSVYSKKFPLQAAKRIRTKIFFKESKTPILHYIDGKFYHWVGTHYVERPMDWIRSLLYKELNVGMQGEHGVNQRFVSEVVDSLRAISYLESKNFPFWRETNESLQGKTLIACRNGLLNIENRELHAHNANYICTNFINIDFIPDAQTPTAFTRYLADMWPGDPESINALQQWTGLFLTSITHFQKALMIIGPKRAGKGVYARILKHLVGESNITSPTLSSMSKDFGLSPFIGKQVAILSDARFGKKTDTDVLAENILRITGEDRISINRKNLSYWEGKLYARFLILSNELPSFSDSSGALASRFIYLRLTESFLGREDIHLEEKILCNLSGILNWALDGLDQLIKSGRLIQPESGIELFETLSSISSPIKDFLEETCEVRIGGEVVIEELYKKWTTWCENSGIQSTSKAELGKQLKSVIPTIKRKQRGTAPNRFPVYKGLQLKPDLSALGKHTQTRENLSAIRRFN